MNQLSSLKGAVLETYVHVTLHGMNRLHLGIYIYLHI